MRVSVKWTTILAIWMICSSGFSQTRERWSIINTQSRALDGGDYEAVLLLGNSFTHQSKRLIAPRAMAQIKQSFVEGDRAVLLGTSGNTQMVVILDIITGKEIDWYYCYNPQRITRTWIISVENYPNHSSSTFSDVVLVYDLDKSPPLNRLVSSQSQFLDRIRVGVPIFPAENSRSHSYNNVVNDSQEADFVLGQGGFLLLSSRRLVFLAATGDDYDHLVNSLEVINITSNTLSSAITTEVPLPIYKLKRLGSNPRFLQASSLVELKPSLVGVVLPASEYGVPGDKNPVILPVEVP